MKNSNKLTEKQERFTLNLFEGMSQREAYLKAGYSSNMLPATLDQNACRLAANSNVLARLGELHQLAVDSSIASVMERQQILTEIARAKITDYQEQGADGGYINIGPEKPNTRAISEIVATTKYDANGANPTLISRIRLHSPTQAIDLLNKMDRLYAPDTTINIDNRSITINTVEIVKDYGESPHLSGEKTLIK
jgi:phage terminase small subunit